MKLKLWRDDVVMQHPVAAAHQRHDARTRLFLSVEHEGVEGFGEAAPQPFALNGDPGVAELIQELDGVVLLQIQGAFEREGDLPSWTRITRFAGSRPASLPAAALVEMAFLDRELRAKGEGASTLWPKRFETPTQATVSVLEDDAWSDLGAVARVRVKTAPGNLGAWALERLAGLKVPILLDFNCSATSDEDVLEQLRQIGDRVEVAAVEQPFAAGNVVDHARLAETMATPVSLDEGVRTVRDLAQINRYHAARLVCIKPARVGGYANARTMIERAKQLGLRPYVGGFFESEFTRHVNRVLCEHCVEEPSDINFVHTTSGRGSHEIEPTTSGFMVTPSEELLKKAVLIATFT